MKQPEEPGDWKSCQLRPAAIPLPPKTGSPLTRTTVWSWAEIKNSKDLGGCVNALRWIIKKSAFPDNGEGYLSTTLCKSTGGTLLYFVCVELVRDFVSFPFISPSKERLEYSSVFFFRTESVAVFITQNEANHFKMKIPTNRTRSHPCPCSNRIHIYINAVGRLLNQRRREWCSTHPLPRINN